MELTLAHWLYAIVTLVVILTMVFRKGVVLPTLLGTFLVAWVYDESIITGFTAVFNANLTAANELFNIFLIITFMVALLHSLKDLGADQQMIAPVQKIMTNGHVAFLVLVVITFIISLFFWPTPAVPLIGALLIPAAVRVGLPVMGAAMVIALAGQGMALSADYVIQVAPMLSASAAGVETGAVADKALVLSLVTGVVAISLAYLMMRSKIRKPNDPQNTEALKKLPGQEESTTAYSATPKWKKFFAALVPLSMLGVMLFMIYTKITGGREGGFEGGDGAALIGGVAVLLLAFATIAYGKAKAFDRVSEHIVSGFVFAFRAMGPVIPIAGFFFLGSGDFSGSILSLGDQEAPSLLFDLVAAGQSAIPESAFLTAFGILIIGIITGLDGSGFSGLPITGSLSGALASGGVDPSTLAAIGQIGTIWTGGGTLVAWSSLVAVAGFCGVSAIELARKNFIPVMLGLIVSTLIALWIW
ncbi:hypothetical protein [Tenuibacillus multivorans]|uniref:H+/gluconate symporter n=1 Tax=Tenuibacillus multivorans TaxID=237069 RepID=A0A1H0AWS4_9BACI|nr:hypothetical protein [Tenuibacillus multivorans]GEL77792.1 membrane protein [Tenuibacillus multivorans]SDN37656.1 H+/gluconate symporter [Tenuibacillus multivorans]